MYPVAPVNGITVLYVISFVSTLYPKKLTVVLSSLTGLT